MSVATKSVVNPYESPRSLLPSLALPRPRAFKPLVRCAILTVFIVPLVVLMLGAPAACIAIWIALGLGDNLGCWLAAAAGVAAAAPISLAWYNRLPMWGSRWFERRLAQVWKRQGLDLAACGGEFVELATADEPRLYHEGSTNWDVGFLFLTRERLVYLGDQTSFSVTRGQIASLRVGPGSVEPLHPEHVFVRWQPAEGAAPEVFSLASTQGPTLRACQTTVGALEARIRRWWSGEASECNRLPADFVLPGEPQLADMPGRSAGPQIAFTQLATAAATVVALAAIGAAAAQQAGGQTWLPHSLAAWAAGGASLGAYLGAITLPRPWR
jgi:hypothetical protein